MKLSTPTFKIALGLLVLALLGARFWLVFSDSSTPVVPLGRMAVIKGEVADDPDVRTTGSRVVLNLSAVDGVVAKGKILAVVPREVVVEYGDALEIRGALAKPQSFETNTGRSFDYPNYLKARGISLVAEHATVRTVEKGKLSILRVLYALKHRFERALERVIPEPQVALMEGLLLGEKSGLSQALTQIFVLAGLVHIIVLSGYNIGIVAEWVLRTLTILLPRKVALVGAAVVVVLFALMAGGGMATIRATLMGLIALLARFLRRTAAALRALFVAVVCMCLYNPLVLIDVGFILSVLATFGLITLAPTVEKRLTFLPEGDIRSVAATTLAVQLFVLPALLYFTGVLSFVSFPVNVLVLPFVPLAMLLGFVAGVLALVHPLLALLPALLGDLLLRAMIGIATLSAALPLSAFVIPAFPVWIALLLYVPFSLFAMRLYWQNESAPQTN